MAVPGARVTVEGFNLPVPDSRAPEVRIGGEVARVAMASPSAIAVYVPAGLARGRHAVLVEGGEGTAPAVDIGAPLATGVHQVDNPVFDAHGNLFVTYSGSRGHEVPVSVFRVRPDGSREPFVTGMVNATSMAFDAAGGLYVSSRFDGAVYRVRPDGGYDTVASELGVACGIAFGSDGTMFVGDRSGTVFRVNAAGRVTPFVTLPPSVAAFHLAIGPEDELYVTGPTIGTYDHIYRIDRRGDIRVLSSEFGRPQGIAVDDKGRLYVVEALAGSAGVYWVQDGKPREEVVAAPSLVGLAIDPSGSLVVSSNDTIFKFDVPMRPWRSRM
jgi:sugar lactone lactonase YvrE